jgi:hypothetical protein
MSDSLPTEGRTVLAHVVRQLADVEAALAEVTPAVHTRRLRPADREHLRRELAGAIASLETVRIWLDAGAPR